MKSLNEWIKENIHHNQTQNYEHIKDDYLKEKLDKGLIRYSPDEWSELCAVSEKDEKDLRRTGVK